MVTLAVVILALVYVALLLIMGLSLVSIMNEDVEFTDDGKITWDAVAFKRMAIKGAIFGAAFIAYFLMIYNFKFIE